MNGWTPRELGVVVTYDMGDGRVRYGQLISGPVGRHWVYQVRDTTGEVLNVPVALMGPVPPS